MLSCKNGNPLVEEPHMTLQQHITCSFPEPAVSWSVILQHGRNAIRMTLGTAKASIARCDMVA